MKMRSAGIAKGSLLLFALALAATVGTTFQTASGQKQDKLERLIISVKGSDLFRSHCSPCHGVSAKGDGPMSSALKNRPANLTVLAKNNGGKFPSATVRKTIAGDEVADAHGTREMPVWGPIFHQIESDQDFGAVRFENLLKYLESIQQK